MKVVVLAPGAEEDWEPVTQAGHDVVFADRRTAFAGRLTAAEIAEVAAGADCIVHNVAPRSLFEALPKLKAVVSIYVGYDKIDVPAATDHGVLVCNTQTAAGTAGMAEATLALILAQAKRLQMRSKRAWDGTWRDDGTERALLFHGSTVGIVGLGAIGRSVARHLAGWDARLLAYTRTPDQAVVDELGVELVDLPTLLAESDVVTLHVPLDDATRGLIGEAELRAMKQTAHLINTARGPVVDEAALCRAIEEEWIAGAALDVFDLEPLPEDSPIRKLDPNRVLLTPHSMANTNAARAINRRTVVESVLAIGEGRIPDLALNPEAWRGR